MTDKIHGASNRSSLFVFESTLMNLSPVEKDSFKQTMLYSIELKFCSGLESGPNSNPRISFPDYITSETEL